MRFCKQHLSPIGRNGGAMQRDGVDNCKCSFNRRIISAIVTYALCPRALAVGLAHASKKRQRNSSVGSFDGSIAMLNLNGRKRQIGRHIAAVHVTYRFGVVNGFFMWKLARANMLQNKLFDPKCWCQSPACMAAICQHQVFSKIRRRGSTVAFKTWGDDRT